MLFWYDGTSFSELKHVNYQFVGFKQLIYVFIILYYYYVVMYGSSNKQICVI